MRLKRLAAHRPHGTDDRGEEVEAAVQLIDDEEATEDEIPAFLRGELGGYEVPRSVDFHAELPRDPNGKLYERKLLGRECRFDGVLGWPDRLTGCSARMDRQDSKT